jgi:hypothetical protein
MFILDSSSLELLEAIDLPAAQFSETVGIMGNCDAFIAA